MSAQKKTKRGSSVGLGNVFDLLSSARDARGAAGEPVRLCVLVDVDAPRELALAVKACLVPEAPGATVDVWPLGTRLDAIRVLPDAALVVAGPVPADVASAASFFAGRGVPVGVVVASALDVPDFPLTDAVSQLVGTVAASDPEALPDALSSWLVSVLGEKDVALAANFRFCRRRVCDVLARRCALENAAMGAVSLIPGSDFPLMTTNQAKLALEMSCAYGADLSLARAAELAGVFGAGLVWRGCARTLAGLVPGIGHVLKAGIGYAGTIATARVVRASLERQVGERRAAGDARADDAPVVAPGAPALSAVTATEANDYVEFDSEGRVRP